MNTIQDTENIEFVDQTLITGSPLVSVLMISYNHEAFLSEAIESVVIQKTDFPFELIISEDVSTDTTRQIALAYQKRYPSIVRVITSKTNVGANQNFARVLSASRGEYVALCEGDDYWCDDSKLQQQVDFLRQHPSVAVTYHDAHYLSSSIKVEGTSLLSESMRRNYSKEQLTRYVYMPLVTMCFRNIITQLPPEWFKVVNGDTFIISLLGEFGSAVYLPDIKPSIYREHGGGIWSGLESNDKKITTIETFYWIAVYHNRIGKTRLANFYAMASMSHLLSITIINKAQFLKWFLINYFRRTSEIYSKLKRSVKCKILQLKIHI